MEGYGSGTGGGGGLMGTRGAKCHLVSLLEDASHGSFRGESLRKTEKKKKGACVWHAWKEWGVCVAFSVAFYAAFYAAFYGREAASDQLHLFPLPAPHE